MVLDSHTHAWGAPSADHPWTNGALAASLGDLGVDSVYDDERLLRDMDGAGIDEAVVVGYPITDWTDNWYTVHAAANERLYGVVMLDPFADGAAEQLRDCASTDGILGVRLGALCPYDAMWRRFDGGREVSWLRDAADERAFWEAATATDALVQLLCDHSQLDQALELVETYPDVTYLLDHFAHVDPETPTDADAFDRLAALADYESVAVKISAAPHRSRTSFPYEDVHEHVRWLVDAFGRERVIWGSDYPNVSDVATYAEARTWLGHVDGVSETDREWLLDRSFRRHVLE